MKNKFNLYNTTVVSLFLVFLYLIIVWVNKFINFDANFYYRVLQSKFSIERIEKLIVQNDKLKIFSYIIWPFILYLKWTFICITLYIGGMIFELKISLKKYFEIVLLAELMPLVSSFTKTLYFYIYPPNSIEEIQNFNPLGLASLLNVELIPKYFLYPFQQFNLFEVGYWLLLAYGIKTFGNIDFKEAIKITSLSYGLGLVIWCLFIVFLQLQFS